MKFISIRQNGKVTSIPRHRELPKGTIKAICKQLEIPILQETSSI